MIKYCKEKWDKNKDKLEEALRSGTTWNGCHYDDLVKLVVSQILNNGSDDYDKWDAAHIHEIDDGSYQGTLIYVIPLSTYQPAEHEYLMTYVGYGSCSGCDTLLAIQNYYDDGSKLNESQVHDFMLLCKDIVSNMIKPYNTGWRASDEFSPCEVE